MVKGANQIVCDTGALITLKKISNGYEIIKWLYAKLIIPPTVFLELTTYYKNPNLYLEQYKIKDFISIKIPTILLPSDLPLHKGEVEAISLAKELDLGLLIEDADGKEYAKRLGIQVSGIAGQILKAEKNGKIDKEIAINLLNEMYQKNRLNFPTYKSVLSSIHQA